MSSMTFFFLFVSILALVFLVVNLLLAPHNPYQEKYSIFECGFHSFLGQNRTQFGVKFFIFALVYLLLDLEILLTFPFALSEYVNDIYGLSIALLFIIIITIGFVFELGKSALKIDSRQVVALFNVKSSNVTELIGEGWGNSSEELIEGSSSIHSSKIENEGFDWDISFSDLSHYRSVNIWACSLLFNYLKNILDEINKYTEMKKLIKISTTSPEYFKDESDRFIKEISDWVAGGDLDLLLQNINSAMLWCDISLYSLKNLNLQNLDFKQLELLKYNIQVNLDNIEKEILRDA